MQIEPRSACMSEALSCASPRARYLKVEVGIPGSSFYMLVVEAKGKEMRDYQNICYATRDCWDSSPRGQAWRCPEYESP